MSVDTLPLATPTAVVVAPKTTTHAEFLAVRKQLGDDRIGIGSSDVPAILGMDRYKSPLMLFLEKTGELPDMPRTQELDDAAEMGLILEAGIAKLLARRKNLVLIDSPGTLAHVGKPWALTNVDYLAAPAASMATDAVVECKNRSIYQLEDWEDGIPDAPAIQTHWHLGVTGFDHAWVAALLGGNTPRFHRVERDQQLIDHLFDIVGAFRQRIIDRNPPPVDGSAVTAELLAHLYEVEENATVFLDTDEATPWLEQYRQAKQDTKDAEARELEAANHLKALAGEAEIALLGDRPAFTWKRNGTFRSTAFTTEHPGLVQKYSRDVRELDIDALKEGSPDLYAAFRSRRFLTTGAWK